MELLLNLIWLSLVVPAFFLWRAAMRSRQTLPSTFVLLVLACTLAILFPVVSASDDMQAMRPEAEEASGQDVARQLCHARFLASPQNLFAGRAALPALALSLPEFRVRGTTVPAFCAHSSSGAFETQVGRAPPSGSLL